MGCLSAYGVAEGFPVVILFLGQQKDKSMNKSARGEREAARKPGPGEGDIQGQMQALVGTFKQYSEQNRKLSSLYELSKQRIQELTLAGRRIGRDMAFLREYCQALEHELALRGYYKHQQQEMLSRKETADGIFLTYSHANDTAEEDPLLAPPPSPENRILNQPLQVQAEQHWRRAFLASSQRVEMLEQELKQLRESLQWERQRRGAASFVLQDRSALFSNIHQLIGEYKRKITLLAHEKKQVERKYKQLKDKVNRFDEHSEFKMIELYSEKIEVLQKLTEKQQAEIENTIELYEVELMKIEERRREEIESYENQRLDLQTENLRLCIDLQKSLNSRDEAALQLMQQKKKNQILLQEIIQLRSAIQSYKEKQAMRHNLAITHHHIDITIDPALFSSTHSRPFHSFSQAESSERSNVDLDYQFSEVQDRRELIQKLQDISLRRQNRETRENRENSAKKSIRDRITITYGQPYMLKPHYRPNPTPKPFPPPPTKHPVISSPSNKSYDSLLQYKRRFIERKPESSLNL